jgi:hypothetical protein
MRLKLREHPDEPLRLPAVMVADPREEFGLGVLTPRHLGNFLPRRNHAPALRMTKIADTLVAPLILTRDALHVARRAIVEHQEGEVAMALTEN